MRALLHYLRRHHVGLFALFIALSGTAYAATLPRNSVGTKQLKSGAVTAKKIKANAVTSAKVKDGTLERDDFAAGQIPAGVQGPAGAQGPAGPQGARGPSDGFGAFFDTFSVPSAGGSIFRLASLSLEPGHYVVTGTFVIANEQNQPRGLACGLGAPGATSSGDNFAFAVDVARLRLEAGDQDAVTMLGGIELGAGETLSLDCFQSGAIGTGTLEFEDIDIGAVRVGALHAG
jgi:hypothetical protein